MSEHGWSLDLTAETGIFLRYLQNETDFLARRAVEAFISQLVEDPVNQGRVDEFGIRTAGVGRTGVVVVWLLEPEQRAVVLVSIERLNDDR